MIMEKGQKLVIVGMGGVGGPAAMLSRKLMPQVDITVIREENRFIVR
jgi:D-arabinose 1-dehydrogenase-like Zn-dependent alcohol dehydrogenase